MPTMPELPPKPDRADPLRQADDRTPHKQGDDLVRSGRVKLVRPTTERRP